MSENPTTFIANKLIEKHASGDIYTRIPNLNIGFIKILVVSINDCDDGVAQIKQEIEAKIAADGSKKFMILHFGVAAGRKFISLERQAKNVAHFNVCPDERGNKPIN